MTVNRIAIICVLIVSFALSGCGNYGVVSDRAYQSAKSLYAICNTKDTKRLNQFKDFLDTERDNGNMTSQELDWLTNIVEQAESGDWNAAVAEVRQIMESQVDY